MVSNFINKVLFSVILCIILTEYNLDDLKQGPLFESQVATKKIGMALQLDIDEIVQLNQPFAISFLYFSGKR